MPAGSRLSVTVAFEEFVSALHLRVVPVTDLEPRSLLGELSKAAS